MDIENMHPFCLPFGLCHDATSSSVYSAEQLSGNQLDNHLKLATRSKTSSPSDELFRQLNSGCPLDANCRSLLSEDSLVLTDESSPMQLDASDDVFHYSLELDADLMEARSSPAPDSPFDFNDENNDGARRDHEHADEQDEDKEARNDWLSAGQYSLLSPNTTTTGAAATRRRRKSLISRHNSVFHHLVDPIDIKSSPTLAQLNLNTNEDPTDGLWDTAATSTTGAGSVSCASSSPSSGLNASLAAGAQPPSFANHMDLLSNCTSIDRSLHANGTLTSLCNTSNRAPTCNHLNHQHHYHSHHHHHQHHGHNHNHNQPAHNYHHAHHNQNRFGLSLDSCSNSGPQSTCLAVAPYRKQMSALGPHQHHPGSPAHAHCCHSNSTSPIGRLINPHGHPANSLGHQTSLKPHALANQLTQRLSIIPAANHSEQIGSDPAASQHQRSTSPALVTSSSSPHANPASETRSVDNKLKENIEYLTALLCNGDKMAPNQQQHQPAIISSTMVRSYTTLAQTLSTGPKLLERQQGNGPFGNNNGNVIVINQHQGDSSLQLQQQPPKPVGVQQLPTNEATSFVEKVNMNEPGPVRRPAFNPSNTNEHWSKSAVESSVSAADSTESQLVSSFTRTAPDGMHGTTQLQMFPSPGICPNNQQRASENSGMKVLSSLLSANRCQSGCTHSQFNQQGNNNNNNNDWLPISGQAEHNAAPNTNHPGYGLQQIRSPAIDQGKQQDTPVPINGRPITLTPLNNSIIQQVPKSRSSVFVQPASPSASSTASSGELGAPISQVAGVTAKKVKAGPQQQQQIAASKQAKNGGRSARPNSLSTDCSLSSHDEGFSSQMDNDDCNSTRDSDEEDDVDSDDESFYGDYTNSDLIGASISDNAENKWTLNMGRTRRNGQKRYFWQYNVQSKGPKGTRMCPTDNPEDPFVLPEASDPVFSNDCQVEGVKHSGKARRGDGNDLTPNPRKLLMIGLELKKLSKIINELAPVTDLPLNARNKTRKEKNKLASRACRLKKKAQHEANKIKLYGLQREHQQVVTAIYDIRKLLNEAVARMTVDREGGERVTPKVSEIADKCVMKVASETSNYVNEVLEKVVSGCIDGGLQT